MHFNMRSDARGAAQTALHLGLLAGCGALVAAAPGASALPAMRSRARAHPAHAFRYDESCARMCLRRRGAL
ncbi:hypothetical protein GCM10009416_30360 [Craurococcus roseus]|uniref:Lipoprotein n=1 Tax=Craurococcus roseus TaxID=77585 RepID=A0ABN1FFJ8_9PROT